MKKSTILIMAVSLFAFSGCFSFFGSRSESLGRQAVSLPAQDREGSIIAGFDLLEDMRPKKDITYMTSVSEKVSEKIIKALRDMRLFDEIHFPSLKDDNIVISGEIRKFHWESFDTMISYIPGLNVLPFLGLPSTRVHSEVEIYLELRNNKTNEAILGFIESFSDDKKYNIYNFKTDKANQDLAFCFNIVLKRIRDKIIVNRNKIFELFDIVSSKIPGQIEEEKLEDDLEIIDSQGPEDRATKEATKEATEEATEEVVAVEGFLEE